MLKFQKLIFNCLFLKMEMEDNKNVFVYIPRKCSFTNRILTSKDHSSVQISIGSVGNEGVYKGKFEIFSLCGNLRKQGRADEALNLLVEKTDLLKK